MRRAVLFCFFASLLSIACGTPRQGFDDGLDPALATETTTPVDGPFAGCASAALDARVRPVDLIVMLDRSSSMLDTIGATKTTRWQATKTALASFFGSNASSELHASLSLFGAGVKRTEVCDAATYLVPRVPLRVLPDASAFTSAIDATFPGGSTPTEAALMGAHLQARALSEQKPDHRVAVLFVTDGLPEGCNEHDDIGYAKSIAEKAKAEGVATFVVGVGPNLENLAAIAAAGGTEKAVLVDGKDPDALVDALATSLDAIRSAAGTCSVDVPPPPNGEQLDTSKVNVSFDGGDTIARDDACREDVGWRYETAGDGVRIVLCSKTCERAKTAKVSLVFGCATVVR